MVVPNMSDGRAFTDYRQNCQMMADFRKDVGIHDPKNVRLMMQQQADQIMESNASGSNNCGRSMKYLSIISFLRTNNLLWLRSFKGNEAISSSGSWKL